MFFVCGAEEITMRPIIGRMSDDFVELRKEVDRVLRHLNVHGRRELRAHTAHAFAGSALALVCFTLEHKHVRASLLREMISNTRSHNAAADDDDVCGFNHAHATLERNSRKVKKAILNQFRSDSWKRRIPETGSMNWKARG